MSTPTAEQSKMSRPLLIVLAVVAVLAVGYLALTMLGSSDEPDAVGTVDPSEPAPSALDSEIAVSDETSAEPTDSPSEVVAVEPTFEIFDARDPFEQLVSEDTGGSGGAAAVGTTQPATDSTPSDDTGSTGGSTPPGSTGGTPSAATVGSTTILLDDVFTSDGTATVLVVVDNEGFEAVEGETVAGKVTVLDIAGNCATMRLGDRRFILCEGEQIQK